MTETKFTPGPWRTFNGTDVFPDDGDTTGSRQIADCGMSVEMTFTEANGNARLIAAAPELYGALEEYIHAMEGFATAVRDATNTPYPWEPQEIALDKARAALAKARGENK